ncbi:MAG: YdjY domain-containing protein [Verrucomicrobiales bacterium]|nr:YdjY domain-containing protein [Verrucomicrobiales bacterium]
MLSFSNLQLVLVMALVLITPSGVLGQANAPTKPPKDIKPIKVSDEEYKLGKLSFNPKTREIWFPCRVNQNEVVLEFAICDEFRGKLHESLLSTKVTPFEIQIAMKLLRWEPSGRDIYRKFNEQGRPIGVLKDDGKGRMAILIRHKGKEGKEITEPLGNWVHNATTKEVVGPGSWTYTGSKVVDGYFLAAEDGAIAAVYRYEGSLCNTFNPGSDDDELWFPVAEKVPPIDTVVTVILKPLPDVEVPAERRLVKHAGDKTNKKK